MRALDKAVLRLRSLFHRRRVEAELDAEFRFHFDQLMEENVARGMAVEEARTAARRTIGGMVQFQEQCRDMRGIGVIESLGQDIRYGIRTLWKAPVFTGVVAATLALGIGGITAVFSVVHAVLLAPLPYEEPGELVRIYQQDPTRPATPYYATGPVFTEIREHASSFEGVVALANYNERGADFVHQGQAERLRVLQVTSGYFRMLRAGQLQGREFERDEEIDAKVVILSDHVWRSRFRGDPAAIGQTVRLSGTPSVVVGIAPAGFKDPVEGEVDVWAPVRLPIYRKETNHSLTLLARLRNGVTPAQAREELAAVSRSLKERWPGTDHTVMVQPLKEDLVGHSRGMLNLLTIAVALVLLVACLNVANLFLVRATGRVREFGIRSALGSGGVRIARQLLVESVLLAVVGGVAGLGLGALMLDVLRWLGGDAIPRLGEVGLHPLVLVVTATVTVVTGLLFGMSPAVRFGRMNPSEGLLGSRWATGGRGQGRFRSGLAVLQVTCALMLLAGAAVLAVSFYRLRHVDLGFRVDGVLTFEVNLPSARYSALQRAAFHEELARRIQSIPGVSAAGAISRLPATGDYHSWLNRPLSGPRAGTDFGIEAQQRIITGDAMGALSIPILAGRRLDARDDASGVPRALVSASFARQAFPGMPLDEVVGQRIRISASWDRQIAGVVGDVALDARGTAFPAVYQAHGLVADDRNWALAQVVATPLPPEQILRAVRGVVAAMDRELVVHRAATMAEVAGRGVSRERFALVLMGAFAFVAVALAAIGLYGVMAYSVRQRTQEFGIRMALGATAANVRRMVLRQAAMVTGAGIALGTGGALIAGRWLSTFVYETSPNDPVVLGATISLLVVVALASSWLPAWRASRVEPRIAIYEE